MSEREDRQRPQGTWARLQALPLFGNVFQGAIISISQDRQWHLGFTLKDEDRTDFAQRPHKHHVPGA